MSTLPVRVELNSYQVEPSGPWNLWLFVGGRRIGKTHRGSSWTFKQALKYENTRWGAAARTWGDARKTLAEGPSGIKNFVMQNGLEPLLYKGKWDKAYQRSYPMELHLANGSGIYLASADNPDSLRGEGLNGDWRDEFCFWPRRSWDTRTFAVSEDKGDGSPAQVLATSTPNGENWVYDNYVVHGPKSGVVWIGGGAFPPERPPTPHDNPHLNKAFLKTILDEYEGTEWGLQEINGLFISIQGAVFKDIEGAVHSRSGRCGVMGDGEWDIFPSDPFVWPTPGNSEAVMAGQDLGTVHPSTLLISVWVGDKLCIVDEVVKAVPTEEAWNHEIAYTLDKWRPSVIHSESADPMVTNAQRKRGLPVKDTTKSKTSVGDSIHLIQQLIRDGLLIIDEKACPVLWREIRNYKYKMDTDGKPVRNQNGQSVVEKSDDDAVDALRYLVLGISRPKKRARFGGREEMLAEMEDEALLIQGKPPSITIGIG